VRKESKDHTLLQEHVWAAGALLVPNRRSVMIHQMLRDFYTSWNSGRARKALHGRRPVAVGHETSCSRFIQQPSATYLLHSLAVFSVQHTDIGTTRNQQPDYLIVLRRDCAV
jgi:hypothetical protein